jgi:hypothetical protein
MAGHRRAEATPSFGRLSPAMTEKYENYGFSISFCTRQFSNSAT